VVTNAAPGASARVWAPGRVNLMGDNTDYAGGVALPMAIDLGTTITGQVVDGRVRLTSEGFDGRVDVSAESGGARSGSARTGWGRYVAAVVAEVGPTHGFEGRISTTIPIGAGLSSSAALEVAVALAVGSPLGPLELALACQRAEHAASGVPCGVMDQLTSICGVEDHALLVDFRALTYDLVALPSSAEVVVIHSGQSRELAGSAYAERRQQVADAEREIGPLRDADLDDLSAIRDRATRARARHVVTENARVPAFAAALASEDLREAGAIMAASHASNRDDFEASTLVVDALVDRLTAIPGVFGARLVGGGFGGCVLTLTEPGVLAEGWKVRASGGATSAIA
jgi:galactokinase